MFADTSEYSKRACTFLFLCSIVILNTTNNLIMSSNKTIFPGMENNNSYESFNPGAQDMNGASGFNPQGTVFPGMNVPGTDSKSSTTKPVVGFLYSVSHTAAGEYWPLHVGPNTIGRSPENDICLKEATISEYHAKLVVRVMKNPEKTICSLQDSASTCGSMINGCSLGFDPVECHNGDIITIGEHYQLYLILIDTKTLGLSVDKGFMPVEAPEPFPPYPTPDPWGTQQPFGDEFNGNPNGTVGLDSQKGYTQKGSTIIMPKK